MKWAFIDSQPSREDFTLREIGKGCHRLGEEFRLINVAGSKPGELKQPEEVRKMLEVWKPDVILWGSVTGVPYFELWSEPRWKVIPKIALWFDEPVTRVECIQLSHVMKATANRPDFIHAIWDGHWREEVKARWGIDAKPIHLAADEEEYHPSRGILSNWGKIGLGNEVVFIGMLHTQESIQKCLGPLPRGLRSLASAVQSKLDDFAKGGSHYVRSWDVLWKEALPELSEKERILVQTESERQPLAVCSWRYGIWAMSKNAVRIRVLREALQSAPLLVFADQKQLAHCNDAEWRFLLGEEGNRLKIFDTSDLKAQQLGCLYHYGMLHLQATDPQSAQGGIPFRVFQTAASGKPLLTDLRPELMTCFKRDKEILGYESFDQFASVLQSALSDPETLVEIGKAARKRFEREHTWSHRLQEIKTWIS
jgi:glycosyltransferase involved in cell wall biosynthesis